MGSRGPIKSHDDARGSRFDKKNNHNHRPFKQDNDKWERNNPNFKKNQNDHNKTKKIIRDKPHNIQVKEKKPL